MPSESNPKSAILPWFDPPQQMRIPSTGTISREANTPTDEPMPLQPNTCTPCTVCCEVLKVDELDKPAGVRCEHCDPEKGCTIYDKRFPICREYQCLWLKGAFGPRTDLRPDQCGVIFQYTECLIPNTLQVQAIAIRDDISPLTRQAIDRMSETALVTLCYGQQRVVVGPKRKTDQLRQLLAERGINTEPDE